VLSSGEDGSLGGAFGTAGPDDGEEGPCAAASASAATATGGASGWGVSAAVNAEDCSWCCAVSEELAALLVLPDEVAGLCVAGDGDDFVFELAGLNGPAALLREGTGRDSEETVEFGTVGWTVRCELLGIPSFGVAGASSESWGEELVSITWICEVSVVLADADGMTAGGIISPKDTGEFAGLRSPAGALVEEFEATSWSSLFDAGVFTEICESVELRAIWAGSGEGLGVEDETSTGAGACAEGTPVRSIKTEVSEEP